MCEFVESFYEDERRVQASGVREVFTPHTPINHENLFKGRIVEVQQILSTLNTPGQHVLLYGDRGVGKSSLANIASKKLIEITGKQLIIKRCSKSDNFSTLFDDLLMHCGIDTSVSNRVQQQGIKFNPIEVGRAITKEGCLNKLESPSWIHNKIKDSNVLMLIDEFGSIQDVDDKHKVAELIKLLSDSNSLCKLFVVGIAESAEELTAGHPSVQRCLREIKLNKMSQRELAEIINNGSKQLKISFSRDAKFRIIRLSSGYPHFTHLLALKAAELAIINEITDVGLDILNEAIEKSVSDCENSLRQSYEDTIQSSSTMVIYRKVLYATALCNTDFIRSSDIRFIYNIIFDDEIIPQRLNQYLSNLVSNSNDKILRRITKGVYRFSDPRMSSYIRLIQSDMYTDKEEEVYARCKIE